MIENDVGTHSRVRINDDTDDEVKRQYLGVVDICCIWRVVDDISKPDDVDEVIGDMYV
jgi:hypothetical protein